MWKPIKTRKGRHLAIEYFDKEYRFLSNFYEPSPVELDGVEYPSVEAAYQAAKTLNHHERWDFTLMSPGQAKKAGKKLDLRPDWDQVKEDVMLGLLRQKFSEDPLRQQLLDTGDEELIEGNWWHDVWWGVCNGVGKNRLGILLMQVRSELQE